MRFPFQGVYLDGQGNVITSATVSVVLAGTTTAATIYAAASGGSAITSGQTTTGSDGYFLFYVDDGSYAPTQLFDVTLSKTNFTTKTYVNLHLLPYFTTSNIVGTTTNDSATTGNIGEYQSTQNAGGGALVALTTNTAANVTSQSLSAGDWDVWGVVDYTFAATTSITALQQGISTTSATLSGQDTYASFVTAAMVPTNAKDMALNTPMVRKSLASTTTVYLVAKAVFTVDTCSAYGTIYARRVR